ncbi:hypothetical protein GCM10027423_08860 [Spirosoma arcticum]
MVAGGFDPKGNSLYVGNLLIIKFLGRLFVLGDQCRSSATNDNKGYPMSLDPCCARCVDHASASDE